MAIMCRGFEFGEVKALFRVLFTLRMNGHAPPRRTKRWNASKGACARQAYLDPTSRRTKDLIRPYVDLLTPYTRLCSSQHEHRTRSGLRQPC